MRFPNSGTTSRLTCLTSPCHHLILRQRSHWRLTTSPTSSHANAACRNLIQSMHGLTFQRMCWRNTSTIALPHSYALTPWKRLWAHLLTSTSRTRARTRSAHTRLTLLFHNATMPSRRERQTLLLRRAQDNGALLFLTQPKSTVSTLPFIRWR